MFACRYTQIRKDLTKINILAFTLIIFGLLFVYSASSVYALTLHADPHFFVKKQLFGLLIGFFAFGIIQSFTAEFFKKHAYHFLLIAIILTSLTLFSSLARHIHGSSRWVVLKGFAFQPSEILKIMWILALSRFFSQPTKMISKEKICLALGTTGFISIILLLQPDFGSTMTLWIMTLMLFFIAYGKWQSILVCLSATIPFVGYLIIRYPYRLQRVLTFLNPWDDAKGTGFQIIQSLVAVGSGGLFGVGIAHSKQKLFYLPMQHTDFIFSIIAEETGFIGSIIVCTLFMAFLYYGLKIAFQINDSFFHLAVCGLTLLISLQATLNIAVCIGLLPTKGLGLPFISYGNSALLSNCILMGLINCFAKQDA